LPGMTTHTTTGGLTIYTNQTNGTISWSTSSGASGTITIGGSTP
jgi:hypothetical protein